MNNDSYDDECKYLLNEILNSREENMSNTDKPTKQSKNHINKTRTFDLKFSSDYKSLFSSRTLKASSKERLSSRIITPKTSLKPKKNVDQIYKDMEKSK